MPDKQKAPVNRSVVVVFVILALIAVVILSSIPGSPLHSITSPFSFVLDPVQKAVSGAFSSVSDFYESVTDAHAILKENQTLKEENAALRREVNSLEEAGRKYEELKSAFQMKDSFSNYDIRAAHVLTESLGILFDVLKIDLGARDGVDPSESVTYPVLDAHSNLVGRVLSTDAVSGKVLLVSGDGFTVTGRINRAAGDLVRIRGHIATDGGEGTYCLIDRIPADASIRAGDEVITSGMGGVFPAGIPIGVVTSVDATASPLERTAILEPYADLDMLDTVFVLMENDEAVS